MTAPNIQTFDLRDVRLLDGPIKERQERNRRYLLSLDADRLLHNFRVNAGLPSSAKPLGGWEAPDCGLRGHFVGHYLSACAQMFRSTNDSELSDRATLMVRELDRCQDALGTGYLSAFPASDLDAIETKFEGAWASYYTLHKILAGLLEVHRYCGEPQALKMAVRLADYIKGRIDRVPPDRLEPMLRTDQKWNPTNEFGGMSEVMQDLFAVTSNPQHLELARLFDRDWFVEPLLSRQDQLTGLHSNTHIPMALGLARRFELTGDERFRDAVAYFWERTAIARSYVNGGSSGPRPDGLEKSKGGEHWPEPFKLAKTLTPKINESCVTHNMLRLTDMLFQWTGDSRYAEFYERAYFNHVLCIQHPDYLGGYIYDHPLGSCSHKTFGHADDTFWCCYGSSIEAFSRLTRGIYYRSTDALYVNLPVASEVKWAEGVRVSQQASLPFDGRVQVRVSTDRPVTLSIKVRIPTWARQGMRASVNRSPVDVPATGSPFLTISRTWQDGDAIEVRYPMTVRSEAMPDDDRMIAFFYGPHLLAAQTSEELVLPAADVNAAAAGVRRAEGASPSFRMTLASGSEVSLVPISQIVDEKFGVYNTLAARPKAPHST